MRGEATCFFSYITDAFTVACVAAGCRTPRRQLIVAAHRSSGPPLNLSGLQETHDVMLQKQCGSIGYVPAITTLTGITTCLSAFIGDSKTATCALPSRYRSKTASGFRNGPQATLRGAPREYPEPRNRLAPSAS